MIVMSEKEIFYKEIIECLVLYGNLGEEEAKTLLVSSSIYQQLLDEDSNIGILDHETPYYWAMHILFSKENPDWYQDRNLWPPPKKYLDKKYGSK
jgi:hypothetical protein